MAQATLTIEKAGTNPNGKPYIKADGKFWNVPEDLDGRFAPGQTYTVLYEAKEGKGKWQGRTFLDVKDIVQGDVIISTPPNPKPNGGFNNNPSAAIMGMVNQYISRGDIALDADAIAMVIDTCALGYDQSVLGENKVTGIPG